MKARRGRGRTGSRRRRAALRPRGRCVLACAVRALGGDGVVGVADRDHARGERDLLPAQAVRIPVAVPPLVGRANRERDVLETLGCGDDPLADQRVLLDDLPFLVVELTRASAGSSRGGRACRRRGAPRRHGRASPRCRRDRAPPRAPPSISRRRPCALRVISSRSARAWSRTPRLSPAADAEALLRVHAPVGDLQRVMRVLRLAGSKRMAARAADRERVSRLAQARARSGAHPRQVDGSLPRRGCRTRRRRAGRPRRGLRPSRGGARRAAAAGHRRRRGRTCRCTP